MIPPPQGRSTVKEIKRPFATLIACPACSMAGAFSEIVSVPRDFSPLPPSPRSQDRQVSMVCVRRSIHSFSLYGACGALYDGLPALCSRRGRLSAASSAAARCGPCSAPLPQRWSGPHRRVRPPPAALITLFVPSLWVQALYPPRVALYGGRRSSRAHPLLGGAAPPRGGPRRRRLRRPRPPPRSCRRSPGLGTGKTAQEEPGRVRARGGRVGAAEVGRGLRGGGGGRGGGRGSSPQLTGAVGAAGSRSGAGCWGRAWYSHRVSSSSLPSAHRAA